ncbi:MAG: SDR family oxidoreductase [Ginsengibacter sp.]
MNVLITGATKGIGKSLSEKFASSGHSLILCSRNESELKTLRSELLKNFDIKVNYFAADLSIKENCFSFSNWIKETGLQVDILINNCGQFVPGKIHEEEDGILEKMISVNLFSAYHLTRGIIGQMKERRLGHIINICSIASITPYANGGSYGISKFALAGFSRNLREELKEFTIKVTTVYPGAVYTNSWEGSGVEKSRIMETNDISNMIYAATQLSFQGCVEEIVVRPLFGDL